MTVLTITIWLSLQLPAGILLGRLLQRGRMAATSRSIRR
jgi:hypothetical protein